MINTDVNTSNNLNFARVSLKTIRNKIKLNASYSLTLLQSNASNVSSNNEITNQSTNNYSNSMFSNDTIIYNNNSIDSCNNDKSLIKSKSIMGCLNDDDDTIDSPSASCDNQHQQKSHNNCKRSTVNSISHQNENLLNVHDESVVVVVDGDGKGNENDELNGHGALSGSKEIVDRHEGDNNENGNNFTSIFDNGTEVKQSIDNGTTISSSTSNENNNEIIMIKKQADMPTSDDGAARNEQNNVIDDEQKLLNVNCKRSTNPFLNDDNMKADGKLTTTRQREAQPEAISVVSGMSELENVIDSTLSNNENDDNDAGEKYESQPSGNAEKANTAAVESSSTSKLKNHPHGSSISWIEDAHTEDFDSDEFCNSEIFGARDNGNEDVLKTQQQKLTNFKKRKSSVKSTSADRSMTNQILTNDYAETQSSSMKIINNVDHNIIIKSAIPTCPFQRQDYRKPGEGDCEPFDGRKCDKKILKLTKKSSNLFHIPSFSKSNGKQMPSLKHVNLHYPNKTYSSSVLDATHDKKYFEKFHSKAKYQLIKLGQKCKILTHHPSSTSTLPLRMSNVRTTIIKTNSSHRKKYQCYNEINKSYQLDDFIRATHLLNDASPMTNNANNHINGIDDDIETYETEGHRQNMNNDNCNSVIYKSYKSEIDLTRNLTYLDAFLNEHFERDPTASIRAAGGQSNNIIQNNNTARRRQQHKRVKSCSKNINYSSGDHNEQHQLHYQQAMINDLNFDESIDDEYRGQPICDGNVTSSSFEYTAPSVLDKKFQSDRRKDVHEIISGRSNTTSSSLSSSDYASVYSSGSKEGRMQSNSDAKTKLISTPEESIEYYDTKHNKHKRLRNGRRSSQPIPEQTNSYRETDPEPFLHFDETNFVELKNSMKKFHPDLYNSVPQFEDLNAIDFFEATQQQYDRHLQQYDDDCETIINPYATEGTPITNKSQLSSSYDDRNIHHKDYLEHYQQQLLGHDDENVETNDYGMKNAFYVPSTHNHHQNKIRPRTLTASSYNDTTRDGYYNPTSSTNDLRYDGRKFTQKTQSYGHPHRVIVSKSKKQKGEVVLEYEC